MSIVNDNDPVASHVFENNADYINLFLEGKSVVHVLFTWEIENFQLIPKNGKKSITSPYFHLESIPTTWSITFFPFHKKGAYFHLRRRAGGESLDAVTVTFRFSVKGFDRDIWFQDKRMILFEPGDVCDSESKVIQYFNSNDEFNRRPLIVLCEMYVSRGKNAQYLPKKEASVETADLLYLSLDMSKLISECEVSDVVILVKELEISSHKAILSARSPVFARMLNDGCSRLKLQDEDYDHIFNVLGYMYSSNLYSHAQKVNLSIGLYECAVRFSISGLKELLAPIEIRSYTKIHHGKTDITWKIEKSTFLCLKTDEYIQSLDCTSEQGRTINWFLEIYPNGKQSPLKSVGVFIKTRQLLDDLYINGTMSILLGNSKVLLSRTFNNEYDFPNFISKAKLFGNEHFLNNDQLIINCKIKFGIPVHCAVKTIDSPRISLIDEYIGLKYLSEDFERMLGDKNSSNATVVVGFANFRLHKEILKARFPVFASMLEEQVDINNCVIPVTNVSLDVFEKMIIYAYTGKLSELTPCFIVKLYETAKSFEMEQLVNRCSHFLQSNLNIKCFYETIVLANKHKDEQLVNKCRNFFKNNTCKVFFADEWKSLDTNHSNLTSNLWLWLCDNFKN